MRWLPASPRNARACGKLCGRNPSRAPHVNNAINQVAAGADAGDLGLHTLQPGETLTAQMSSAVERVQ